MISVINYHTMVEKTYCGDCINYFPNNPEKPEDGGSCLIMSNYNVNPTHPTFDTLDSHGLTELALLMLVNPEKHTCFIKSPFLENTDEFSLLELLEEIDKRKSGIPTPTWSPRHP